MTVKELISILHTFDPNLPVYTLEDVGWNKVDYTPAHPEQAIMEKIIDGEQIHEKAIFL